MGYVMVTGYCVCCNKLFSFNPNKVPSIRIDGSREPICKICVDRVNPTRKKHGLDPIVPLPDAYEPADENEVNW